MKVDRMSMNRLRAGASHGIGGCPGQYHAALITYAIMPPETIRKVSLGPKVRRKGGQGLNLVLKRKEKGQIKYSTAD
jgi:hypothetical protein